MLDPEAVLYFKDVPRWTWILNGPSIFYEIAHDDQWLRKFAAVTFTRVVDNWLVPALGLKNVPKQTTGIDVVFASHDGTDHFTVRTQRNGRFTFHPTNVDEVVLASVAVSRLLADGAVCLVVRLANDDAASWGGCVNKAISENVAWNEVRLRRTADTLESHLDAWVIRKRELADADGTAMSISLVDNACAFLNKWPEKPQKDGLCAWKRFVTAVVGRDLNVLVAFCPRRVFIKDEGVISCALDALADVATDQVERMHRSIQAARVILEKPHASPRVLFAEIKRSRIACSPGSVLAIRSGDTMVPSEFYIDESECERVETLVLSLGCGITKRPLTRCRISDVVTRTERWVIDHHITVQFVEPAVLRACQHSLRADGAEYMCEKDGVVATHAIARLMLLIQKGLTEQADALRKSIRQFHVNTDLGFPLVNGKVRRKRVLYFSDYNQTFSYRSDKTIAVPQDCFPLSYTSHMHDGTRLDIWIDQCE
jgi:hypothetical protein